MSAELWFRLQRLRQFQFYGETLTFDRYMQLEREKAEIEKERLKLELKHERMRVEAP